MIKYGSIPALLSHSLRKQFFSLGSFLFLIALILFIFGIVSTKDLLHGLTSNVLWTIISMYIVGSALYESGDIVSLISHYVKDCKEYRHIIVRLLLPVTFLSGFMNNTPLVATFIPICRYIASQKGYTEKKFLLPLSYAAILGGNLTFIGATTHILLNEHINHLSNFDHFSIVSVTPLAVTLIVLFYAYLYFFGFKLLPKGKGENTGQYYQVDIPKERKYYQKMIARSAFGLMIILILSGIMHHMWAALLCAFIVMATGCVSIRSVVSCFNPQLIMIIISSFPITSAFITLKISDHISYGIEYFFQLPVFWMYFSLYIIIWLLTEFVNNIAIAMLFMPILMMTCEHLGVPAEPFIFLLMVAVASAFITPIGYQTNIMVYVEGKYRPKDFFKFGWPIGITSAVLTSLYCMIYF